MTGVDNVNLDTPDRSGDRADDLMAGLARLHLGAETLALLTGAATSRAYAPRAEIQSNDRLHVGILIAGLARVFLHAWDGRQLTVRHRRPVAFLGKFPHADGARVRVRIEALTPCVVLAVPTDAFEVALLARPDLALALHADAVALLDSTYATLGLNAFASVQDRLIHILLELADRDAASNATTVITTQQQLADDIGSTREVVTRALSDLSAGGLIATGKGRIHLLDPARLAGLIGRWTDPASWSVLP